jgi:hypothetical protein
VAGVGLGNGLNPRTPGAEARPTRGIRLWAKPLLGAVYQGNRRAVFFRCRPVLCGRRRVRVRAGSARTPGTEARPTRGIGLWAKPLLGAVYQGNRRAVFFRCRPALCGGRRVRVRAGSARTPGAEARPTRGIRLWAKPLLGAVYQGNRRAVFFRCRPALRGGRRVRVRAGSARTPGAEARPTTSGNRVVGEASLGAVYQGNRRTVFFHCRPALRGGRRVRERTKSADAGR